MVNINLCLHSNLHRRIRIKCERRRIFPLRTCNPINSFRILFRKTRRKNRIQKNFYNRIFNNRNNNNSLFLHPKYLHAIRINPHRVNRISNDRTNNRSIFLRPRRQTKRKILRTLQHNNRCQQHSCTFPKRDNIIIPSI